MFKSHRDLDHPHIDTFSIMLFGLLHCESSPNEQAKHYFNLICQSMKITQSAEISKDDIRKSELFTKLCQLACTGLFKVAMSIEEAEL